PSFEPETFKRFAQCLVANPELLTELLETMDSNFAQPEFLGGIAKQADKGILPHLHLNLASKNRVICSNAARMCGVIRDRTSIRPLIKALDLDSALSKASIVWALGQLKAVEALPNLESLFFKLENDRVMRSHNAMEYSNVASSQQNQWEAAQYTDNLQQQYRRISGERTSVKPQHRSERLLTDEIVIKAIAAVAVEKAQPFFRKVSCGKSDYMVREIAIEALAQGGAVHRQANIQLLKNLTPVHTCLVHEAAVSRLILGDDTVKPFILEALEYGAEHMDIIRHFERVKDKSKLTFTFRKLALLEKNQFVHEYLKKIIRGITGE
ncbi:MAG: HEAT repeat domain-containing protein, partial [bacterium]|nr:HEAT repeat domain-containing protein [bacterium]